MKKHLFIFLVFLCPLFIFSQNVGIGTTTPDFKLDVESLTDARARIYSPNSSYAGFLFDNNIQQYFIGVESVGVGSQFDVYDNTANALRLRISSTGNVGIGLTSPSELLHVNGNVKVAGIISGVSDPISAQDAATKNYVDTQVASAGDDLGSHTATAPLNMSTNKITSLTDPTDAQDAATKAYVDFLETTVALLEAKVNVLWNFLNLTVQQRLDSGETPIEIYNSDNSLLDSLYGKTYAGGLIAYFNTSNGTGLIAAPVDQSTGAEWGCKGDLIGGTSSLIGTGQANTTLIVDGCAESGIAARICDDLVIGIYDDWFLPSKDELDELYENLQYNGYGGFSGVFYWSSTEYEYPQVGQFDFAWCQDFFVGFAYQLLEYKDDSFSVRAVRAF